MDANGLADLGIMPLGADQKPASLNIEQQNKLKLNAGCPIWLEIWYQVSHWGPGILISSHGDCPMLVKMRVTNLALRIWPLVVVDGPERLWDLHEEVPVEAEGVEQPHLLLVVAHEDLVAVVPEGKRGMDTENAENFQQDWIKTPCLAETWVSNKKNI